MGSTLLRARNRILDRLVLLIPQGKDTMGVCRLIKGQFRARRRGRRVCLRRRLLGERRLVIMLDGALRIQSSSNDTTTMLRGTVK